MMTNKTTTKTDLGQVMAQLDALLNTYLVKKAPAIPENIKEVFVKYGPYVSLVLIVLSLPAIIALLGLTTILMPASYLGGVNQGLHFTLTGVGSVISLVLSALALPGLFKRKISGWNFVFYSTLVSAVVAILSFNIGSLIIGTGLALYVLYQIKSYYK